MAGDGGSGAVREDSPVRRVALTVGACALLVAGERLPLPFIDEQVFGSLFRFGGLRELSPVALGYVPFILGFVIVEFVATIVPRWRPLRDGGSRDRSRLVRAAWTLALAIATIQAWGMTGYLRSVRDAYGGPLLPDEPLPLLAVGASLVAGVALSGAMADLISRRGLGNGFAVLLTLQMVTAHAWEPVLWFHQPPGAWSDASLLTALALLVIVPLVIARLARQRAGDAPRIPLPTCSLLVLQLPGGVVQSIYVVAGWLAVDAARVREHLFVGGRWAWIRVGIVVALALPLSRLFFPRPAVEATWRRAVPSGAGAGVRRALSVAHLRSLALVAALAALPLIAAELDAPLVPSHSLVVALAMAIAVAADLGAEWRARWGGRPWSAIRPLHRVYAVEPALRALAAAGITGFARARHFRALFHFFAPYAPIELLVPPERAAEADAIVARVVVGAAV